MSVLDPDHLLEQAERLIQPPPKGPPRQVDLRRAVSAAYYALFHTAATALADEQIGRTRRSSIEYQLAYRSLNHRWLKELCKDVVKETPGKKFQPHFPVNGFSRFVKAFAGAVPELQDARHGADYDPSIRLKTTDVQAMIDQSRSAVMRFRKANSASRNRFLALLAFPPRSTGE